MIILPSLTVFANNQPAQWLDSGGDARDVLNIDGSDQIVLGGAGLATILIAPSGFTVGTWSSSGLALARTGGDLTLSLTTTTSGDASLDLTGKDVSRIRFGESSDAILERGAANRLEVRNGTNGQNFFIYQTFTDSSNYSRGQLQANASAIGLFGQAGGSGTERPIRIGGNGGNDYWQFAAGATTNLTPADDGAYSIGNTSRRVKDIFLGGYVQLGITDTDGSSEGALWYDASEDKLKFKTAAGVETVTSA